jgi:hypothetical protein
MGLFTKKAESTKATSRSAAKVVVTGKRVKGVWRMESALPLSAGRKAKGRDSRVILETENRRVRTLH